MKGLLLKDFLVAKSQAKTYLVLCVFYMILGLLQGSVSVFSGFVVIVAMMMPMGTFSYDQLAHWDRFAATIPAGRRDLVRAKYVFALTILGVSVVLCTTLGIVGVLVKGDISAIPELLAVVLGCGFAGIMMNLLLIPLILKFGVEKGRIMMVIITAAVFASVMGILTIAKRGAIKLPNLARGGGLILGLAGLAFVVVACATSYFIAQRVYAKKEL